MGACKTDDLPDVSTAELTVAVALPECHLPKPGKSLTNSEARSRHD